MTSKDIHFDLNSEKKAILAKKGSILVVANPGTGKTKLLAHKFLDLVKSGIKVEDILCLTFTRKAKKEMEDRILKSLKENNFESSKLNVFTFHSYALDGIEEDDIVSSDLLRFNIYEYLLENEVFVYPDDYLLENIVPKLENAIRYIKNYGVLPSQIKPEETKALIEELKKGKKVTCSKEQLDVYFDHFLNIFNNYEENKTGSDYTDILINFLKIKMDKFKWVLVDELQDVNNLEAKIALKSGENFFTVGDKKQAIFGFQGGSISNFELFKELGIEEKLVDNFRSTNQVLSYARAYYLSKNLEAKEELEGLKSFDNKNGNKPVIIEYEKDDKEKIIVLIKDLVKDLKETEQLGVIVRTNSQILKYSKLLDNSGLNFSATFSSSSEEARENIIKFIYAIFSNDMEVIKNAFFSPFFPCEMQKSFELSSNKKLTIEELKEKCPRFFELKEKTKNIEDVNTLFKENILPVCFAYGEEYVSASIKLQEVSTEAINQLKDISLNKYINYLKSADLLSSEITKKSKIILTTIHKAKGLEYRKVIYLPSKSRDLTSFQDAITEAILKSNLKNYEKDELEEEDLRADFVAMTRAKEDLYIITKKSEDYLNEFSELKEISESILLTEKFEEKQKLAYNLFVNKEYEKAKELLTTNKKWLEGFITNYFENLDHISFSAVETDAYKYLTQKILRLSDFNQGMNTGSIVHKKIERYLKGEKPEISKEEQPFFDNALDILKQIEKENYKLESVEYKLDLKINEIVETSDQIPFLGFIDAVFKKDDEYLLIDWKTNKHEGDGGKHRQQLALYKKAFATKNKLQENQIKVGLCYIGLRENINDGKINQNYNQQQPRADSINTITEKIQKILTWKQQPALFIEELQKSQEDDVLIRVIKEQIKEGN